MYDKEYKKEYAIVNNSSRRMVGRAATSDSQQKVQ